jgi:hypothetical protein
MANKDKELNTAVDITENNYHKEQTTNMVNM